MSKAAGTLITTHNATYVDPRLMPGYRGHCPGLKFDYGETYGNATAKYFQDYRSEVLNTSKSPYAKGGSFPTFYSHDPDIVIGNRTRGRDRYLDRSHYELYYYDHDRTSELNRFDKLSQTHREFYKDKTGEGKPVTHFQLPSSNMEMIREKFPFYTFMTSYTGQVALPPITDERKRKPGLVGKYHERPTIKERAIRDVYFEKRGGLGPRSDIIPIKSI